MTSERTESITIAKTIVLDVYDGDQIVGQINGGSRIDEQDRWVVRLGLAEASGHRDIEVVQGDMFEFAGSTWRVAKVYEPNTRPRGMVAKLERVDDSGE